MSAPARRGRPSYLADLTPAPPPTLRAPDNTAAVHLDAARQSLAAAREVLAATEKLLGELAEYHRSAPAARPQHDEPRWATATEAAERYHVSRETIYRWAKASDGVVRRIRPMDGLRISLADLDRWVAETTQ